MIKNKWNALMASCLLLMLSVQAHAQLDVDIDLTDDTPALFDRPIFWIGVAVVIIIVALIYKKK